MPLPRELLTRLQRLREHFLDDARGERALADYWRDERDLAAYDAVFGARIGWKWDEALAECRDRGFARADDAVVLDFGCGSGVAARAFVRVFGAREVLVHDRSHAAAKFAASALRAAHPKLAVREVRDVGSLRPDVLLVSHVLGELDARGEAALRALIERSTRVLLVEPGSKAVARRLSALRDELLATFHVIAPCPHAQRCPALANGDDWCHFFAPPAPEVFTTSTWALAARELGIDLRALPYSFLAFAREPAAHEPPPHRVLGRANVGKHDAALQVCEANGLRTARITKRADPATWRALKKDPEALRTLPS
jgi:SAM-dependent methyltransferase